MHINFNIWFSAHRAQWECAFRQRTGIGKNRRNLEKKNRLRWLGHVYRMENNRFARQAIKWVLKGGQRKRGRRRKNWMATIEDDLNVMGMSWEEAEITTGDRTMWRRCVVRCAEGTGRTKVWGMLNAASLTGYHHHHHHHRLNGVYNTIQYNICRRAMRYEWIRGAGWRWLVRTVYIGK